MFFKHKKRRGSSMTPYAIIGGAIVTLVVGTVTLTGSNLKKTYCTINQNVIGATVADSVDTNCPSPANIQIVDSFTAMVSQWNYCMYKSGTHSCYPIAYGYVLFQNMGDLKADNLSIRSIYTNTSEGYTKLYASSHAQSPNMINFPTIGGTTVGIWNIGADQGAEQAHKPSNPKIYTGAYPFCDEISTLDPKGYCVLYLGSAAMASVDDTTPPPGVYTGLFNFIINDNNQSQSFSLSISNTVNNAITF